VDNRKIRIKIILSVVYNHFCILMDLSCKTLMLTLLNPGVPLTPFDETPLCSPLATPAVEERML
jgi:hypothetical protein